MSKLVLIYSNEHEAWWKPNYCGYTPDITKAGIFEYEDALKNYPRMSYDEDRKDYFVDMTQEMIKDRYNAIASEVDKLQDKLSYLTSLLKTINDCKNTSEPFDKGNMTSKDAVKLAYIEFQKDFEEGEETNQWLKNVIEGLKQAEKDLEALEIIKKKLIDVQDIIYTTDDYELYKAYCEGKEYADEYICNEEEFKLLKERLKNE